MNPPLTGLSRAPIAPELRPWVARMVRIGYVAKGAIYLLIGTLAFRLATGLEGGRLLDPIGALRIVLRQPFGWFLLAGVCVGILTYSAWQLIEGIWDTRRKGGGWGWKDRALTMIKGVAYGSIGWQALRMVLGLRRSEDDLAEDVIRFPLGDVFMFLVGVGVVVYGFFEVKEAWRGKFGDDLDEARFRQETGAWGATIGRIGNGGRGVILMTMGAAFVSAALERDPKKAGGIAEALATLFSQPFGVALAAAVAFGLICFGVFQLLNARYTRL